MGIEAPNNFHAGVKYDATTQTIVASKGVTGVTYNGVGDQDIVLDEPIAQLEVSGDTAVEGQVPGTVTLRRVDDNTWKVLGFDNAGAPIDLRWNASLFRLPIRT